MSQRFSERIAKQQESGQRKWKVDFFTSKTYAGVAQKNTFHGYCTSFLPSRKKRHTDKYCQTLDTWTHLIALLFCHMADCQSLRDICKGLEGIRGGLNHLGIQKAPSRNALSHQNAKRDALVFRDIYRLLHKRLGQQTFTCRFREGIKASRIMLLDSSVITLCLNIFNCSTRRRPPHSNRSRPSRRKCGIPRFAGILAHASNS
ncbi:MAG: DUF4372 domain-containing protein [Akkermansia sp.]|nr:DUF4372 domain-containing protein [Akkermansia sp.]